jgi:branched-chain amino acid transport system substrate-binding protein
MLSPSTTTPELSGLEDFFFRASSSLSGRAYALAQRIYQGRHISRVAAICDTDNSAYSKAFLNAFGQKYHSLGGELVTIVNFSSKKQPDFGPKVSKLQGGDPDGLLIIAADMDTALIAQRTRLMGWSIPLFTTAWAQTETLINNGGRAVEGVEIEIANTFKNQTPAYLDFKKRYLSRYGQAPAFGAPLGYEAAKVLAAALKMTGGQAEGLAKALTSIKNFRGLTHNLSMDKYGDAIRPFYLGTIRDGKYVDIEASIPNELRD